MKITLSPHALAADDGVVALLHAVPALVAVHAPEAALDGGDPRVAEGIALLLQLTDEARAAGGRHVASVEEAVDEDLLHAALLGHVEDAEDVDEVAVHAAVGHEAHDVQGLAVCLRVLHGLDVDLVLEELAVLDLAGHLGQDLEDDAARADVGVTDLGVAHLPGRQADVQPGGLQRRMGPAVKEPVQIRGVGDVDGVALGGSRQAEAVHDDKNCLFAHKKLLMIHFGDTPAAWRGGVGWMRNYS